MEIQGRPIHFPIEVKAFNAATLGFAVPAAAATALLPGDAFEVVDVGDGLAQLVVSVCDYRDNPWGDYNEVNLGFLARPAGAPADVVGSFVYRMPVDQEFTCEAGNRVMGFPKVVEVIDARYDEDEVAFRLVAGGRPALGVTLPRPRGDAPAARVETVSYSYLDGVAHATPLGIDLGPHAVDPADVTVEVGEGPIADELRSLGLPAAPGFCTWGEGLTATFDPPTPVRGAAA